ncbi:MAG: glycosyltransferase family 39 protein, partial [Anaerolineae bacterium]|nr:glycosyltransferase family 39 protein [Anaerolineae bacterium]
MTQPKHLTWLWILPVLLILSLFALTRLNADGYWFDEWWTLFNTGHPYYDNFTSPFQVWERIATRDNILSPGFYIGVWGWAQLVGWSEFATRFLAFLCGILAIALTYRLAWRISKNKIVALGAMVALGSNAYFLFYLHEIRHYAPLVLMTVWCADSYVALVNEVRGKWFYRASLIASCAGLLYTQNLGIAMIAVIGMTHLYRLFRHGLNRNWVIISACILLGSATFIPWGALTIESSLHKRGQEAQSIGIETLMQLWVDSLNFFTNQLGGLVLMMILILWLGRGKMPALIWSWLIIGFIALTGVVIWSGIPTNRYTIILLPALALVFGYGVVFIGEKLTIQKNHVTGILIGGMAVAGIFFATYPQYESLMFRDVHWREPVREFVWVLEGRTSADDALIFHPQEGGQVAEVLPLYLRQYDVLGVPSLVDTWQKPTQNQYIEQAQRIISGRDMLWVGMSLPQTRFGELFDYLIQENGFSACGLVHQNEELTVSAYAKMPESGGIQF